MAVTFTQLTTAGDYTDRTTYTTASVTLQAGLLYLLTEYHTLATSTYLTSAQTTGGAVVFGSLNTVDSGAWYTAVSTGMLGAFYYAVPSATVTDTVALTLTGMTGCFWSIMEVTGATGRFPRGAVVSGTQPRTATLAGNIINGNARITFAMANTNAVPTVSSGTWVSGSGQNHTLPNSGFQTAWNAAPAVGDKSATWAVASGSVAAAIVEVEAAVHQTGAIPI